MNPVVEQMVKKPDFSTQRRWPRYQVDLRLKLRPRDSRAAVFGQGSDVSEGGMAAYIPSEINVGETVEIEVQLPYSKDAVVLHAAVRNRNGFRYGLEYTLIADTDRAQLLRSIKALALIQ